MTHLIEIVFHRLHQNRLIAVLLFLGMLQACASLSSQPAPHAQAPSLDLTLDHSDVRFIVLGDWGNYGSKRQHRVAAQMNTLAGQQRVDFIVSTGDNIYDKGVQSFTDPLWQQAFESVYNLPNIANLDWYATLGNHDYQGNYKAQIEYNAVNPRWILPSTYYSLDLRYRGGDAKLVLTDTNAFKAHYHARPEKYPGVDQQDPQAQLEWLGSQLEAVPEDSWKIVIGHHPMYSTGKYPNDKEMIETLEPPFKTHGVDAYFSGHDHSLQHQKPLGKTHYFISGAGAKLRKISAPQEFTEFAESKEGFAYVELSPEKLRVSYIGRKGKVLHTATLLP